MRPETLDDFGELWHFYLRVADGRLAAFVKGWSSASEEALAVSELLSLEIEAGAHGPTVRVSGEIDIATAPKLQACLESLAREDVVAVDLSGVAFVESSGIAVLVAEHKRRVAAGEQLVVTGASPLALRVFEATGVDQVLDLDGDSRSS